MSVLFYHIKFLDNEHENSLRRHNFIICFYNLIKINIFRNALYRSWLKLQCLYKHSNFNEIFATFITTNDHLLRIKNNRMTHITPYIKFPIKHTHTNRKSNLFCKHEPHVTMHRNQKPIPRRPICLLEIEIGNIAGDVHNWVWRHFRCHTIVKIGSGQFRPEVGSMQFVDLNAVSEMS